MSASKSPDGSNDVVVVVGAEKVVEAMKLVVLVVEVVAKNVRVMVMRFFSRELTVGDFGNQNNLKA